MFVPTYYTALDPGQAQDPCAWALAERTLHPNPHQPATFEAHYAIRWLHRWPLKTAYPAVVDELRGFLSRPPLRWPMLGVDYTGVGRAVVDELRAKDLPAMLRPILITAGFQTTYKGGAWHVPKRELVSTLFKLSESRRLVLSPHPLRAAVLKEIDTFKVKVSLAGAETFEAWREQDHDDLILAIAMACWLGERYGGREPAKADDRSPPRRDQYVSGASNAARRGLFGLGQPK